MSIEEKFALITADEPSFSGFYYSEQRLIILTTDTSRAEALKAAVDRHYRNPQWPDAPYSVRLAQYRFTSLSTWARSLSGTVMAVDEFQRFDLDEVANKLRIGVATLSGITAVQRLVAASDVPYDAVIIELAAPVELLHAQSVRDSLRPIPGGVAIERVISQDARGVCTLGYNSYLGGNTTVIYALTNSHCTPNLGQVDSTIFYQPYPYSFGKESHDPPFVFGPFASTISSHTCGPTVRCRYSDAALVRYDSSRVALYAYVARTQSLGRDSATHVLNGDPRTMRIAWATTEPLAVGNSVDKLGQQTGWTFGQVSATCLSQALSSNYFLLCQDYAQAGASSGDSGSPVFFFSSYSYGIRSNGIVWGGIVEGGTRYFVFSPIANVIEDLQQSLWTSAF